MRPDIRAVTISILAVGILGAGAGFYAGSARVAETVAKVGEQAAQTEDRLALLEGAVGALTTDATALKTTLETEAEIRTRQAEETDALKENISKLSASVSTQESSLATLSASTDIAAIIKTWSPFVYAVSCEFTNGTSGGSAVLERTAAGMRFVTNRHVITEDDTLPETCSLSRFDTNDEYAVAGEDVIVRTDQDFAEGPVSGVLFGMMPWQVCSEKPEIGDRVVILGYPTIGARESITATEGIISGFDKEYYTTSAKIEKGNSGGAAIHVAGNCLLGLPTLVFAGRIESIARILPAALF